MAKVNGTHQLWCCRRHPQTCVNCIVPKRAGKLGGKSGAVAPCYFDVPAPIHLSPPLLSSSNSPTLKRKTSNPCVFLYYFTSSCALLLGFVIIVALIKRIVLAKCLFSC